MDETAVTNREFSAFVDSTGYETVAERAPDPAMYPGADPDLLVPGSITFSQPPGPIELSNPMAWWAWTPGANWRNPWGPGSDLDGKEDHPVTQVCFQDADAYARWAGKRLPSEQEWERAARGGIEGAEFAWGNELSPGGRERMNRWIGRFPWEFQPMKPQSERPGTVQVRSFDPNDFGLFEMTGNTWEWTSTWFEQDRHESTAACCAPRDPQIPGVEASRDPASGIPRKVLKGGSFLCAENYCSRYRPASRIPETVESATCHISFRCISPATT